MQAKTKYALSGTAAGLVNGLFGGGGGMVLVPLLNGWCGLEGKQAFATCVAAILPLSAVSAAVYLLRQPFDWAAFASTFAASTVPWPPTPANRTLRMGASFRRSLCFR